MEKRFKFNSFYYKLPWIVICFTILYISTMLAITCLVDFKGIDIFGIGSWLEIYYPSFPLFWIYGFSEASPTEHMQWFFLGASIILATVYFVYKSKVDSKIPWIWLLLLIGLTIMFYEDMRNFRHDTVDNISSYLGIEPSANIFWLLSLRSTVELLIYFVLGIIMVISLIYILRNKYESLTGKKLLVAGYIFYGVASVASASRGIGNWYANLGNMILGSINDQMSAMVTHEFYQDRLGFYFVDFVLEEPIELLGAVFITAALISFINHASDEHGYGKYKKFYLNILLIYAFVFWFAFQGFYFFYLYYKS